MTSGNPALAAILDRGDAAGEADALLAALVDFGVLVPVDEGGSVIFVQGSEGRPALPAYVSEQACRARLPRSRPVFCDALRLMDIARSTGVDELCVFSAEEWARVPFALVFQTLERRGLRTPEERSLSLTRSAHPAALAFRDALGARLLDFPGVETVWIALARWAETGQEHLMLHFLLAPGTDRQVVDHLMKNLLSEHVTLAEGDPSIAVRILDGGAEAQAVAEIDAMGLDTVRADHAARSVTVVSADFDR